MTPPVDERLDVPLALSLLALAHKFGIEWVACIEPAANGRKYPPRKR